MSIRKMIIMLFTTFIAAAVITGCTANGAATVNDASTDSYAELLGAEIRGIPSETVEGYLAGEGMGMALPAELNNYPGPRHVLDFGEVLELTEQQTSQIQSLFDIMQTEAIELGKLILEDEAGLEQAFRSNAVDEEYLKNQLNRIGQLSSELRFVHLRTHLATVEILSPEQITHYNELRGYGGMSANHEHSQHK